MTGDDLGFWLFAQRLLDDGQRTRPQLIIGIQE